MPGSARWPAWPVEGRSSLRTWTFSILVNRARTRGAREARTVPHASRGGQEGQAADDWAGRPTGRALGLIDDPSSWQGAPEKVALSKEVLSLLDEALSGLPDRQRRVLTMRDVCGMPAGEVCTSLASRRRTSGCCCTGPGLCCALPFRATTVGDRWHRGREHGG